MPEEQANNRGRAKEGSDGRDPGRLEGYDPGSSVESGPEVFSRAAPQRSVLVVWGVIFLIVAGWCIAALGIGVNFAGTLREWLPILALGGGVPALLIWQANRVLSPGPEPHQLPEAAPSAKDRENELLQALAERGELTPITAAMRTSLTAEQAAEVLDGLAGKGYLRLRVEDGVQAYTLGEQDRRGIPGAPLTTALSDPERQAAQDEPADPATEAEEPAGESPEASRTQPMDEPLSERELEVLALLASGRTTSEIARDLYVAVGTVKTHTNNIYRKLGASRRSEALARAREIDLIP